jgi:hypothetical protein
MKLAAKNIYLDLLDSNDCGCPVKKDQFWAVGVKKRSLEKKSIKKAIAKLYFGSIMTHKKTDFIKQLDLSPFRCLKELLKWNNYPIFDVTFLSLLFILFYQQMK